MPIQVVSTPIDVPRAIMAVGGALQGNRSRGVEDPVVQHRITDIVGSLIVR